MADVKGLGSMFEEAAARADSEAQRAPAAASPRAPAPVAAPPSAMPTQPERGLFGLPKGKGIASDVVNLAGDVMIPRTAAGWGFLIGTAGAGPLLRAAAPALETTLPIVASFIRKIPLPIARVILGAVGNEAGAEVQRQPVGTGLKEGLIAGTTGEIGTKALSTAARAIPVVGKTIAGRSAAKEAANVAATKIGTEASEAVASQRAAVASERSAAEGAQATRSLQQTTQQALQTKEAGMAKQVGQAFGDIAPPLQAENAQQLSQKGMLPRDSRRELGTYYDRKIGETEQLIGGSDVKLRIPSLASVEQSVSYRGETMKVPLLPEQQYMTLREASDKLKDIGYGVWRGADGTLVKLPKMEQARLYNQARGEIEKQLADRSPDAAAAWNEGRHAFSAGNALIGVLKREGVFDRAPGQVNLDQRGLQQAVQKNQQVLRERLAPDELRALNGLVFQGKDIGTLTAPRRELLKSPTLPGLRPGTAGDSGAAFMRPPQSPTRPFSPGEYAQILFDSAIQRFTEATGVAR